MLIDMHAHVVPDGLPAGGGDRWPRIEEADGARALVSGQMRLSLQEAWYDAERRLAAMDASGVDAEVVSPLPPLLNYRLPASDAVRLCRGVNAFIARLREVAPSRFYGLGTVPMQDPDLACAELSEVRAMGLQGVEIGSNVCGVSLGDDRLLGFFQGKGRLVRDAGHPDIFCAQGFGVLRHFRRFIDEVAISYPERRTRESPFIEQLAQVCGRLTKKVREFDVGDAV